MQDQDPTHTLSHQAAVKPLAWCPWKAHLLATGGGSTDRTIRLWNTLHGREAREPVDTGSQVSGLVWNAEYKELCSSHGYAEHQLTLWKYPMMSKMADLKGTLARQFAFRCFLSLIPNAAFQVIHNVFCACPDRPTDSSLLLLVPMKPCEFGNASHHRPSKAAPLKPNRATFRLVRRRL